MSSSCFEVKESESDTVRLFDFEIDGCEENGILSNSDIDLPKDHTYNKDPIRNEQQDDMVASNLPVITEVKTLKKESTKTSKAKQTVKKNEVKEENSMDIDKTSEPVSPKKRGRPAKQAKLSETKDEEKNSDTENDIKETISPNTQTRTHRRGIKRKIEPKDKESEKKEKENVLEEVQNISSSSKKEEDSPEKADEPPQKRAVRNQKVAAKTTSEPIRSTRKKVVAAKSSTPKREIAKNNKPTPKLKEKTNEKGTSNKSKSKYVPSLGDEGVDQKNLPKGWLRRTVVRQTGRSAGHVDVYVYSPNGTKFRSRLEVKAYLARTKSSLKFDDFDFVKKNPSIATPAKVRSATSPQKSPVLKKKEPIKKKRTPIKKKPTTIKKTPTPIKAKSNEKKTRPAPVNGKKSGKLSFDPFSLQRVWQSESYLYYYLAFLL